MTALQEVQQSEFMQMIAQKHEDGKARSVYTSRLAWPSEQLEEFRQLSMAGQEIPPKQKDFLDALHQVFSLGAGNLDLCEAWARAAGYYYGDYKDDNGRELEFVRETPYPYTLLRKVTRHLSAKGSNPEELEVARGREFHLFWQAAMGGFNKAKSDLYRHKHHKIGKYGLKEVKVQSFFELMNSMIEVDLAKVTGAKLQLPDQHASMFRDLVVAGITPKELHPALWEMLRVLQVAVRSQRESIKKMEYQNSDEFVQCMAELGFPENFSTQLYLLIQDWTTHHPGHDFWAEAALASTPGPGSF